MSSTFAASWTATGEVAIEKSTGAKASIADDWMGRDGLVAGWLGAFGLCNGDEEEGNR